MGRVYDALKRAGGDGRARENKKEVSDRRNGDRPVTAVDNSAATANKTDHEHPWEGSSLFAPNATAHTSASTAHTAEERVGSALSGAMASRAAGATLDAAGATRATEFVSADISAARVEPHLIAITQPRAPQCEQYRSLRTRLLQAAERKKMQAFVITSASVAEGKTLTALNLAWLLAQTDGVRALLIDSDLRQPCASEYLGIDTPKGLSDVLAGEAKLEDVIIKLEPAGLYFLPGGSARDDVAEVLSGPKFERVLADARRLFDFILIDAPPLGIFTDANVIINRADGALLVVRSGKTRYAAVDHVLDALPRDRMLGVVLNGSDENFSENAYYYQRYYRRSEDTTNVPPPEAPAAEAPATLKDEKEVVVVS
jgi:capsular exopolysaccharide synthesis family protein